MNTTRPTAATIDRFIVINAVGQVVWAGRAPSPAAAVRAARAAPFTPEWEDAFAYKASGPLRVYADNIEPRKPRAHRLVLGHALLCGTYA